MFPGEQATLPPSPSISSAPTTSSDHDQPHAAAGGSVHPQNNNQSWSNVPYMENSQTEIHTQFPATVTDDIVGQLQSFQALACDQMNSNDHNEDATGYDKVGQPPSIASIIENRHKTSQSTVVGGNCNVIDLPPSPKEASENGISAGDRNLSPEKYNQMSMTGKSIWRYKPPAYYLDDEKY
ncbi:hypothetical protein L6452_40304 [Arctium lappa]|uniref:Uncharacterized protein n=1 Tax=Arctium lappa TaxID=4217 RepID=A0ACB8XMD5_ARCLA|nr:hypothetical protein L6452_40304 [Arctium lappa]